MSAPSIVLVSAEDCMQFRVLSEDGETILASVRLRALRECKSIGWILALETLPEYRRKGLGYALLARAEVYAREQNLGLLLATIWRDNSPSRALFAKCGFSTPFDWYSSYTEHTVCMYRKKLGTKENKLCKMHGSSDTPMAK